MINIVRVQISQHLVVEVHQEGQWWFCQSFVGILMWWRHQMETFFRVTGSLCAEIDQLPVNYPHKGQWRGALIFSLISAWTNGWVNKRDVGDLRRHRAHCDVTVMKIIDEIPSKSRNTRGWRNWQQRLTTMAWRGSQNILHYVQHIETETKWLLFSDSVYKWIFFHKNWCMIIRISRDRISNEQTIIWLSEPRLLGLLTHIYQGWF